MSIWSSSYKQSVFKRYYSDKQSFYLQLAAIWQKSTGIDMEQKLLHCHLMYRAGSSTATCTRPRPIGYCISRFHFSVDGRGCYLCCACRLETIEGASVVCFRESAGCRLVCSLCSAGTSVQPARLVSLSPDRHCLSRSRCVNDGNAVCVVAHHQALMMFSSNCDIVLYPGADPWICVRGAVPSPLLSSPSPPFLSNTLLPFP